MAEDYVIDKELGTDNCGNEETFWQVLQIFYESIDENIDQICGLYDSEDWKNYTVQVHSLKSTAMLCGAKELAEEARALEMAGKSDDIAYIRENNSKVMEHLRCYREPAGKLLESGQGGTEDTLTDHIFAALRKGAAQKDDDLIIDALADADDEPFSDKDTKLLDEIRELFGGGEYDKIISVIDGR